MQISLSGRMGMAIEPRKHTFPFKLAPMMYTGCITGALFEHKHMAFCELGSVFGGCWLQFLLHANTHTQGLQSASVKVEQSASLMQLHSTQLSSVVRQEKPNRGAPRVLIKTPLGSHTAAEKQTWSRLEAKRLSEASQLPFSSC